MSGLLSSLFGGSKSSTQPGFIFPEQVGPLTEQFGAARQLAGQQLPQIQQMAGPLSGQLLGQGQQFLQGLQGAGQNLNQFTQTGQPGGVEQQLAALQGLGQFNLNQSLEGITDRGIAAGGIGSARSGLAAGQSAGLSNLGFMGAAGGLLQSDIQRRQQAGIAQAGIQAQSALGGLSQLQGQFNLGISPFQAQFSPLLNAAGVIGSPQPLQGASSRSEQRGITQGFGDIFSPIPL